MITKRKSAEIRERDLNLAISRISRGRSHTGETKISFSSVAREAGVSTALIHNHYPKVGDKIRELQGRTSREESGKKQKDLTIERAKTRELRQEIEILKAKIASLASINEVLIMQNKSLTVQLGSPNVFKMERNL